MDKLKSEEELVLYTDQEERVQQAQEVLKKYKDSKKTIDQRATDNQEWWRLRHWEQISQTNGSKKNDERPASAWLFNSIINKHADIMDNYPAPNILPREQDDEEEAKTLSKIIPIIMEQNCFQEVYSQMGYDLEIEGGFCVSVVWDNAKRNGLGDCAINNVDVHNVFWQPGITDIQDSADFFYVSLEDIDSLKVQWPDYADRIGPTSAATVTEYLHDDNIETTNMAEVIDHYYKQTVMETSVVGEDPDGNPVMVDVPKTIVHYQKFTGDVELYCSEDDPEYRDDGFYKHGHYPFVVKTMFPVKDSVWGFGYLDVMKDPQKYVDVLDQAILKNAMMTSNPRFWAKKNADINIDDFLDWSKTIIEVSGELDAAVKPIQVPEISAAVINHRTSKIDELKETSGNRDFSQGSTAAGVTAASAIASLQEAGSKLSRDMNKVMYGGVQDLTYLVVELTRQYSTEPRSYRVDNDSDSFEFVNYNASEYEKVRKAELDIKIVAEKQSPFSKMAQNELAKEMYSLGWFAPENSTPALVAIDMMDFEGKEKIKEQLQENSIMLQQYQQMAQIIAANMPEAAAQMGLIDPQQAMMQSVDNTARQDAAEDATKEKAGLEGTVNERAAQKEYDTPLMGKNRLRAANQASVG